MNDLISRQAAIDVVDDGAELIRRVLDNMNVVGGERSKFAWGLGLLESCIDELNGLPSAQSEISRIEQELHGKTAEEQYEFLYWLLLKFALTYTDSRLAVVEWLRGEEDEHRAYRTAEKIL